MPDARHLMNDTDRATLSRLLTEHGTAGVASELASVLHERARTTDDPYEAEVFLAAARRFAALS